MRSDEPRVVPSRIRAGEHATRAEIATELAAERRVERHPPGASLELGDEDDVATEVHVTDPQAKRLTNAEPGAVEHQQQGPIERSAKAGALQISCEPQQRADVKDREHVGRERGLRRELGPADVVATSRWMKSTHVEPELPNHRHVLRHAYRESPRATRQPRQDGLVEPPRWILLRAHGHEAVEAAQGELGAAVSIPSAPLELDEFAQRRRQRADEHGHLGTGRASARSRRIATRT